MINISNFKILPSQISFKARKDHKPPKDQISMFDLQQDTFELKNTEFKSDSKKAPKEILQHQVDKYLNTQACFLLGKSPKTGKCTLKNSENNKRRSNLLNAIVSGKVAIPKNQHKGIFIDTMLITLMEKLKDNDPIRKEAVDYLVHRHVLPQKDGTKDGSKMYYTRMSVITKALTKELTKDKSDLENIIKNDKKGWFGKKFMLLASFRNFVQINQYKPEKLKDFKNKMTDYKATYTYCREKQGIENKHPIETVIGNVLKEL